MHPPAARAASGPGWRLGPASLAPRHPQTYTVLEVLSQLPDTNPCPLSDPLYFYPKSTTQQPVPFSH